MNFYRQGFALAAKIIVRAFGMQALVSNTTNSCAAFIAASAMPSVKAWITRRLKEVVNKHVMYRACTTYKVLRSFELDKSVLRMLIRNDAVA